MFIGIMNKCIRANTGIQTKETKLGSSKLNKVKKGIKNTYI